MTTALAPVAALLFSVALLLMGNGLQGTLLPVRAGIDAFAATDIGIMGTAYFVGFGAGCYFGATIVRRAGHIRTFAALASVASSVPLVHAVFALPIAWWALRGITGFCFAILYIVIESWLNERATNQNRGAVLATYNAINLTVITVGQMMLTLADPADFTLFVLASVLVSFAVVPVSMTASAAPTPIEKVGLRLRYLYGLSPLACVGVLAVGMANGGFWTLAPVFAQQSGLDVAGIATFMSVAVLAGAAGQWPIGRLSDRRDRRQVIFGVCLFAGLAGLGMVAFNEALDWGLLGFAALFGLAAFPLYAVCVAHLNDFIDKSEFVEASSGLLMLYAAGAAIGPIPASIIMGWIGADGLFAFTAAVHVSAAIYAAVRMRGRVAPPPEQKEPFISIPRTSPALYAIDPRGREAEADDGLGNDGSGADGSR